MTGFGSATSRVAGRVIAVTISSVNSKRGLDPVLQIDPALQSAETALREWLPQSIARGRVTLSVGLEDPRGARRPRANWQVVDPAAVAHYRKQFRTVAGKNGGEPSAEFLMRLPGVLREVAAAEWVQEDLSDAVLAVANKALKLFQASRRREGAALKTELLSLVTQMDSGLLAIRRLAGGVTDAYRASLIRRLQSAGFPGLDADERVLKEVALFADRSDISEEMARLAAHLLEARRLCGLREPVGRALEFLCQEIGREVNTIGSKANQLDITRQVLDLKAVLEKFREQILNVE